jgi:beta-phosphoglucomutase-like phosphatase (HAD superfamily)
VNLVFDLDGTLIDARPRMYRLFCQLVPQAAEL